MQANYRQFGGIEPHRFTVLNNLYIYWPSFPKMLGYKERVAPFDRKLMLLLIQGNSFH